VSDRGSGKGMTDQDWTSFDIQARDSAAAAHVAMWLREQMPAATIKSAPDDLIHMDVLHCRAALPDRTAEQTEQAVKAELRTLREVDGPEAVAHFDFDAISHARAA
jgi:hypothetical protein